MKINRINIAAACQEANRRLCIGLGDFSQSHWGDAPCWQVKSIMNGVDFHLENPDASASASHDNWLAEKEADGWVYGETKDPEAKTHPCMVPFDQLPPEQQAKDVLFRGIVHALAPLVTRP